MKTNTFKYSDIFQKALDKHVLQNATSAFMEANAGKVIYTGGKNIKIPTITTDGLADYDRAKGFVDGAVTLEYQTYTMTQDRGRTFSIDAMDVDETNFVATAGNVIGDFQTRHVIPEIDAYRYSKIAQIGLTKGLNEKTAITEDNIYEKLTENIVAVQDIVGNEELIIIMSGLTQNKLSRSKDFSRILNYGEFKNGEMNTRVQMIDSIPIIMPPSARLKTSYQFLDGTTGGQEKGGFKPAEEAKDINWLIFTRKSPIAVSKTDKVRVFSPDVNQKADAWKVDYRKYHDLWITDENAKTIFANIGV